MKTQRNPQYEDKILNDLMEEIAEDRSNQFPGVTSLIYCITKTFWEHKYGRGEPDRQTKLFFVTGLGLERALLKSQKEGNLLVGEHEGVFYHIDGLDENSVVELKSTRGGIRKKINPDSKARTDNYRDIEFEDYSKQ